MEKRFILFIALSFAIFGGTLYLQHKIFPQPEVPQQPADGDADKDEKPEPEVPKNSDDKTPEPDPNTEDPQPPVVDPDSETPKPEDTPKTPNPKIWTTLGSVDPDREKNPYRMLVTFNSRGAAVERIELSSPAYLELSHQTIDNGNQYDRGGYLGHLAPQAQPNGKGVRIGVVGPGTPASLAVCSSDKKIPAGLQPDDIILEIDGQKLSDPAQVREILNTTQPKQNIRLAVTRAIDEKPVALEFDVTLVRRPMQVIRPEKDREDSSIKGQYSYLCSFISTDMTQNKRRKSPLEGIHAMREGSWSLVPSTDPHTVAFTIDLGPEDLKTVGLKGHFRVTKTFALETVPTEEALNKMYPAYGLNMEIKVENIDKEKSSFALMMDGPTGLPLEGWWYTRKSHNTDWGQAGIRDIVWWNNDTDSSIAFRTVAIAADAKEKQEENLNPDYPLFSPNKTKDTNFTYAGVDAAYFSSIMKTHSDSEPLKLAEAVAMPIGNIPEESSAHKLLNVTFRLISTPQDLNPGESFTRKFTIFSGPKYAELLGKYGLEDTLIFGWFGFVARPMLWFLNLLNGIFHNYGVSIIFLTILVRAGMFPFGRKMALNAQKMQELAPELKAIADQYKSEPEKRLKAQQDLYRKHNYNPLSGCLVMFIQLPIFIGLYRALSVAVELRQAPLIPGLQWCSNLAGPDHLYYWENYLPAMLAGPNGWLGPYLNILPLITIVLFIAHQKLFTPPAMDEQAKMQQQIMMFMMIFIGVMFFKVPSGLCIYFIVSSLWGIAERQLLPKPKVKPASDSSNGGPSEQKKSKPRTPPKKKRRKK